MARSNHEAWAQFRFSVVGALLAAPPEPGELRRAIAELAAREWRHPTRVEPFRIAYPTIERWYYIARRAAHPVAALRKSVRSDRGQSRALSAAIIEALNAQYRLHPQWSLRLHYDNLVVLVEATPQLGRLASYSAIRCYMRNHGLERTRPKRWRDRPGEDRMAAAPVRREVRSFEHDHAGALWHLDFHIASRVTVVLQKGDRVKPVLLAILDDCTRLCCHAQWYLREEARTLIHGLIQAMLKRGLPRAILMDNGGAMIAAETKAGLHILSIVQNHTLAYSAYQNGKQEHFWAVVEGRLMAMLDSEPALTLDELNLYTQAWVERDYHQNVHSEIGCSPLERSRKVPDVLRPAPSPEELRRAFLAQVARTPRRSDGTFTLGGARFEIPNAYRHLRKIFVQYAHWDLARAFLVDERTGATLVAVYPLDRTRNADGMRRVLEVCAQDAADRDAATRDSTDASLPPLLRKLVAEYSANGLPPAFLPDPMERT